MRAAFTASAYGLREGLLSVPRLFVGNVIAVLAAMRAISQHRSGRIPAWDKTRHIFPAELAQ
jgi:adsorption protein B